MKCAFCLADGADVKITKEHLFSVPICGAVGLDRATAVATLDGNTGEVGRPVPLDRRQVRMACEACNSGWMNELEKDTARVLRGWINAPRRPLRQSGCQLLTRWLGKTSVVFGFAVLGARRFIDDPTDAAVPDLALARKLGAGSAIEATIGACRTDDRASVWGAGNSSVTPVGPDRISSRAVNVLALNLNGLQLWGAFPVVQPDKLLLPRGVARLSGRSTYAGTMYRSGSLDPSLVNAHFSDATTQRFFEGLESARAQPGNVGESE